MKGTIIMRGSEIIYAMEHASPALSQAIWTELTCPKPSMDKIRESKAREMEIRALKAKEEYAKASIQ